MLDSTPNLIETKITKDGSNIDEVQYAGWDQQARVKAQATIEDFKTFMEANKDEITALSIFYNQPYNRRNITYEMIKEVLDTLEQAPSCPG